MPSCVERSKAVVKVEDASADTHIMQREKPTDRMGRIAATADPLELEVARVDRELAGLGADPRAHAERRLDLYEERLRLLQRIRDRSRNGFD